MPRFNREKIQPDILIVSPDLKKQAEALLNAKPGTIIPSKYSANWKDWQAVYGEVEMDKKRPVTLREVVDAEVRR